jgi:hypothetical protein
MTMTMTMRCRRLSVTWLASLLGLALSTSATAQPAPHDDVVVVARLLDAGPATPHCGRLHVGVLMRYQVVRVVRGSLPSREFLAAVGCPTMSRASYGGAAAGTLRAFRVGDVHRLVLSRTVPSNRPSVIQPSGPLTGFYWTVRVDPAAP